MHELETSPDKPYDLIVVFRDCEDAREWMKNHDIDHNASNDSLGGLLNFGWNNVFFYEAEKIFLMDWCTNIFIDHAAECCI